MTWSVKIKKFQEEISIGDRVFIWRTEGRDYPGGIIALTEVNSNPYYSEKDEAVIIDLKVKESRISQEENMLLRSDLKKSAKTKLLSIIRSPQGTNFKCTDSEGESLIDYWKNPLKIKDECGDVEPAFDTEAFNNYLSVNGVNDELISKINYSMKIINNEIEKDDIELGKGYKIGHSYFCNISSNNDEESWNNWYKRIIKFEIKPLLEEYWFDNKEKVSDLLERIK